MSPADIGELDRRLQRLHNLYGRRAPTQSDIQFWFAELRDFSTADVFDALAMWERHGDDDHPPTLRWVARTCRSRRARIDEARQARIASTSIVAAGPNAHAFKRLWADTHGDVRRWHEWRARITGDPHAPQYVHDFLSCLPPWDEAGSVPAGTETLRPIGISITQSMSMSESEREALEERLAMQMEGA